MRRITLWLLSTIAALVLAFSYRTSTMGPGGQTAVGAAGRAPTGVGGAGPDGGGDPGRGGGPDDVPGTSAGGGTDASGGATAGPGASTGRTGDGSYQGSVAQTRWGPVQVGITVSGKRITEITVLAYPNGNHRDEEINAYALPVLRQTALAAQSADIDSVSGATVTSEGYKESLQAAIDAAGLR